MWSSVSVRVFASVCTQVCAWVYTYGYSRVWRMKGDVRRLH